MSSPAQLEMQRTLKAFPSSPSEAPTQPAPRPASPFEREKYSPAPRQTKMSRVADPTRTVAHLGCWAARVILPLACSRGDKVEEEKLLAEGEAGSSSPKHIMYAFRHQERPPKKRKAVPIASAKSCPRTGSHDHPKATLLPTLACLPPLHAILPKSTKCDPSPHSKMPPCLPRGYPPRALWQSHTTPRPGQARGFSRFSASVPPRLYF